MAIKLFFSGYQFCKADATLVCDAGVYIESFSGWFDIAAVLTAKYLCC